MLYFCSEIVGFWVIPEINFNNLFSETTRFTWLLDYSIHGNRLFRSLMMIMVTMMVMMIMMMKYWFCSMVDQRKKSSLYFQPGSLLEILSIANLRHDASRIWIYAEPESGFIERSWAVVTATSSLNILPYTLGKQEKNQ